MSAYVWLWKDIITLRSLFDIDTSELPEEWSKENPSTGHCHVVSKVINFIYGGDIYYGLVRDKNGNWWKHYWNVIDSVTVDATLDQFIQPIKIEIIGLEDDSLEITEQKALVLLDKWIDITFTKEYDGTV